MAEGINPLILPIGADISQFKYSVNDVKAEYKALSDLVKSIPFNLVKPEDKKELEDLSRTIKVLEGDLKDVGEAAVYPANSIKGITDRIQELKGKKIIIDADASEQEILQLNQEIQILEERLVKLNALGKKDSFSNISNSSKQARVSLTNLSLVAQDLPFGFIAIQNNIPNLIQSFAKLSEEAKISKVSIGSQLAAEFKGTAGAILGIGLAVSVAVSAVTVLVQKYGSLGAAFDAFFGKINPLQNELNRASKLLKSFGENYISVGEAIASANTSSDKQIVKLEALGQTVLDVTKTEKARKSALEELKKIDEDRFGRYDVESGKLKGLTDDIQQYTNVVLAKAIAEKLADRSAEALAVRESERNKYGQLLKQLDDLKKEFPNVEKAAARYQTRVEDYLNALKKGQSQGIAPIADDEVKKFNDLSSEIRITGNNLTNLNDTYSESRKVLKEATLEALAFGSALNDNKTGKSFKFELQPLTEILTLEQRISQLEKLGTILLDTTSKESDRIQALKELSELEYDVWGGVKLQDLSYQDLRATLVGVGKTYQQLILQEKQRIQSLKETEEAIKRQDFLNKQDTKNLRATINERRKIARDAGIIIPSQLPTAPPAIPINEQKLKENAQIATDALKSINKDANLSAAYELATQTFFNPISEVFEDFLNTGKFAFDEFAKSIIKSINQIVSKIIATGIVSLLFTIFSGGFSASAGGAAGGFKKVLSLMTSAIGGQFGRNNIQNPSMANINPGGMQMSGQVVFVQRGSDLVGVLNRTNGTINRVG